MTVTLISTLVWWLRQNSHPALPDTDFIMTPAFLREIRCQSAEGQGFGVRMTNWFAFIPQTFCIFHVMAVSAFQRCCITISCVSFSFLQTNGGSYITCKECYSNEYFINQWCFSSLYWQIYPNGVGIRYTAHP